MSANDVLLFIWFGYLGIMLIAIGGVVYWAAKNGQFADQDHARYLPLTSPPLHQTHTGREQTGNGEENHDQIHDPS